VIGSITSVGKLDPLVPQRNFWASTEGVIAGALRAVTITVGLHFTLVLLILCVSLCMSLANEWRFVQGPKAYIDFEPVTIIPR